MRRWGTSLRRRLAGAALLGVLAVALSGAVPAQADPGAQASIIGGKITPIAELPSLAFVVAQHSKTSGFSCTGSVIAPRVILTAAHCVEDLELGGYTPADEYSVVTGMTNPHQAKKSEAIAVASTHVFPHFDPGTVHGDSGILILAEPTAAPPIPLATAADAALYQPKMPALMAGWGLTHGNATQAPRRLQSAPTTVLDSKACSDRSRPYYPVFSAAVQACTSDPPAHKTGVCFGDSGGPLIANRADGSPVEIAIASSVGPECNTGLPDVYTRADLVSSWAAEWIASVEGGAPSPDLNGPQARVPSMSKESAIGLVAGTLTNLLGDAFLRRQGLRGDCKRAARARVKCELAWITGSDLFFGTVSEFYVLKRNAVLVENHFGLHRVDARCWFESPHRARCPMRSAHG